MKKILYVFFATIVLFLTSCGTNTTKPIETTAKPESKVIISFYDGNVLLQSKKYINTIELIEYSKDGYTFNGWFLDEELTIPFDQNNISTYFENSRMDLFAKMDRIMQDFVITVQGKLNENETVLNPLFTWENINGDLSYSVSLIQNNEEVMTGECDTNHFQFSNLLNQNTEYEFKLTGNDSKYSNTISFKTISSYTNDIKAITLMNPYMDHMIIQRDTVNIVAGTGPKRQIITLSIGNSFYYSISDENGYFEITLPEKNASFIPVELTVSNGGSIEKTISDVLFGDVYLFSGQSNMQWTTGASDYERSDIVSLTESNVRFFSQDVTTATTKQKSVRNGKWFIPDNYNCMAFSAIATMTGSILGRELEYEAPIGIITAYQGDTNIANWMGEEYYTGNCSTKYIHYNAMVYPLRFSRLKGVVWYQGCNNSASGCDYKDLLLKLFENYRDLFDNQDLNFFVIGLACYDGDSGNNFDFSYVRESQAKACALDDKAYFISTCDDGDPTYIHPRTKRYICMRVAKSIFGAIYNKDYYKEGPSYKSHTVSGNTVTIELNNSLGLKAVGEIKGLYLAGEDGKYHPATAEIVDGKIVAASDKVSNPVYIKYGFGKSPFVNIFNKDDFAITPFRTDEYNTNIDLFDYDKIDDYYFHPDGSDMEVSINNGNLAITKKNDGKGYGSVRLNKWGAIAYEPQGFRFTIKGTNSGAAITIRAIEGDSYEIWGYKIIDDFEGEKTFSIGVGDFIVVYGKQNNIFEPQKIGYMEVMVEFSGSASFELCEARFIKIERTKPMNFYISSVTEGEANISIALSKSLFAESYEVEVLEDNNPTPLYKEESDGLSFIIDKSLFEVGKPYYINAVAKNELGSTSSQSSGYVFYLKDDSKVVVCNFDFKDQASLDAYMASSMSVHEGLTTTLEEEGVKIVSGGKGWQQFIFKLDTGVGKGMTTLEFYADFSNYKGSVIMQLADASWKVYSYTIDLSEKSEGTFIINFEQFILDSDKKTPFTTQNLMWVMFNFSDSKGDGYILLDDVTLTK